MDLNSIKTIRIFADEINRLINRAANELHGKTIKQPLQSALSNCILINQSFWDATKKPSDEDLYSFSKKIRLALGTLSRNLIKEPDETLNSIGKDLDKLRKDIQMLYDSRTVVFKNQNKASESVGTPSIVQSEPRSTDLKIDEIEARLNAKEKQLNEKFSSFENMITTLTLQLDEKEKKYSSTEIYAEHRLSAINSKSEKLELKHDETLNKLENLHTEQIKPKIDELEKVANQVKESFEERLKSLEDYYISQIQHYEEKKNEVNKALGIVSEKILAGGYDGAAINEKKTADLLRWGSIACMVGIVAIIGYSLYETTKSDFNLYASILRFAFSILLFVPATYLARESNKHRQQQISHIQKTLDITAIGPYIESIPEPAKHLLKAKIAEKLFAAQISNSDTTPLNIQELLIKIIEKMEFKKEPETEK